MAAYVISDLDIRDIEDYLAYQRALKPLLQAAGARYLARGGAFKVYEGDHRPKRLLILEFPSMEAADAFFESPAYLSLETQRKACSSASITVVDGL